MTNKPTLSVYLATFPLSSGRIVRVKVKSESIGPVYSTIQKRFNVTLQDVSVQYYGKYLDKNTVEVWREVTE